MYPAYSTLGSLLTISSLQVTSGRLRMAWCKLVAAERAEDSVRMRPLIVAGGIMFMGSIGLWLEAHQAKPLGKEQPAQAVSAKVWRSTTTGREYGVWMDKDHLHTEWVNLPPAVVQGGGYVRSESRRVGSKWVGTVRSYLPCETTEAKERTSNRCQLETKIEFDSMTADRITGRAQAIHKFDCKACRLIEAAWADFSWIPRDQKAAGNKQ